jgi:tetratricopeptide (TPR) repeat protein
MDNNDLLEQAKYFFVAGLEKLCVNNFIGSENDFQTSLKFAPNRLSVLVNLSIVQIKLNKYEDAEKLINDSLILYPKNNELLMGLVEIYEKLISIKPDNSEVYFKLGNSFKALGMYDESISAYNAAIILNTNFAEAYFLRGQVYQDINNYQKALDDYNQALSIDSSHTNAILNRDNLLEEIKQINMNFPSNKHANVVNYNFAVNYLDHGNILKDLKRLDESIASYDRAIEIDPCFAQAYSNRGIALRELNCLQEAIASYNKAIEINPDYAEAFSNRGIALRELKKLDEALVSFERAIEIKPDYVDALSNRGNALKDLNRLDEALASYNQAIQINPNFYEAYYNRGVYFGELEQFEAALASYDQAIKLNPDYALAYSNRGNTLKKLNRYQDSLASYYKAIELNPRNAEAYSNLGILFYELKHYEESLANYDKAIDLDPGYAEAYFNKSVLLLSIHDFESGWHLYDWRWKKKNDSSLPFSTVKPKLDNLYNSSSKGRKILIWGEQGVGDQVLYSGMLDQFFNVSPSSQIMLDKRLLPIFERSFPQGKFVDKNIAAENIDYDEHLPLPDLAKYFRTCTDDFDTSRKSFLKADQSRANDLRTSHMGENKYLCGITWSSKIKTIGADKSIELEDLLPILKIKNITFVNLQYGDIHEQLINFNKKYSLNIKDCLDVDNFNDLDGHAALIQACDFVVTISNTSAHISGAIGKETFLMCPSGKGLLWYWCNQFNGKSLWYPSVQIYEQSQIGNWFDVVQRVKFDIENKINSL